MHARDTRTSARAISCTAHEAAGYTLPVRQPAADHVGTTVDAPDRLTLRVVRLDPDVALPAYAHPGDAGLDLAAARATTVGPGARAAIPTGLAVAIPEGWVGLVHPRSGLALREGLTVVNAPGTIDSGYRGEVQVLVVNLGDEEVALRKGERVAQLVLQRVGRATVVEADSLEDTSRGAGGFGSTGRTRSGPG